MLVVEELYKEAVLNTERKLIIFNGELDRIRSGCILFQIETPFYIWIVFIYSYHAFSMNAFIPVSACVSNLNNKVIEKIIHNAL